MKKEQCEKTRAKRRFNKKIDGPEIMKWYAVMPTAELAQRRGLTVKQIENFLNREKLEPGKVKDPKVRSAINSENGRKGGRPRKKVGK